jgi:hypothetical protein
MVQSRDTPKRRKAREEARKHEASSDLAHASLGSFDKSFTPSVVATLETDAKVQQGTSEGNLAVEEVPRSHVESWGDLTMRAPSR